jgi:hypothetical protein
VPIGVPNDLAFRGSDPPSLNLFAIAYGFLNFGDGIGYRYAILLLAVAIANRNLTC